MLKRYGEVSAALSKFEMSKSFSDLNQMFFNHQPIARAAENLHKYQIYESDNKRNLCFLIHALSEEHMQKFKETNGVVIAASRPILESTKAAIYVK